MDNLSERKHSNEANSRLNEELEQQVGSHTAETDNSRQAEERLIRQQEFSRALLESMADGVVACDSDGVLTLFNRTAREWHGMDPLRLPQEEWAEHYDLFHLDGSTPLPAEDVPLARAFRGEIVIDAGMSIVAKGRSARSILANGSVIRDESGKKLGAVVVMRDISELRRAEERLRKANDELEERVMERTAELHRVNDDLQFELAKRKQAEEMIEKERKRMEVILSAQNTGLSLINPDMTIAWVNQKVRDMFPGSEPVGQVCHVFYESRETICEGCGTLQTFLSGNIVESEQPVPGTGKWYYIISQPIRDTDGRVVNVLEGIADITARKQAENEIKRASMEWSAAMDASEDIICLLDIDRRVMRANKAFYMMTRTTPQTAIGRHIVQLVHPEGEDGPCPACIAQEEKRDLVFTMEPDHAGNPSGRSMETTLRIVRDDSGRPVSMLMTMHDLTHERQIQKELTQYRENLEELVRERTDEVAKKNAELERMNRLFVGRELRMVELKKRIAELENKR